VQLLRQKRRLYPGNREEFYAQEDEITHLVIRDDLPEMLPEDQRLHIRQAELAIASPDLASRGRSMTEADYAWDRSGPWLARFSPDRFLTLTSAFRAKAFDWPEPLRAFLLVEYYLHRSSVLPSTQLLEHAKAFWRKDPKPPDHVREFLAERLHILAFLNFTPSELIEWLEFAVSDEVLRRRISHHPSNEWLRAVIPEEVAKLARRKVLDYSDEPATDDTCAAGYFDFWARLAMASAEPDADMFDRILTQFQQRNPSKDRRYHWLCLLFAFATDSRLERGLQTRNLKDCFNRDGCSALWFVGRQLQPQWLRGISLEDLLKWLPIDEVGKVIASNGEGADFKRWGLELLGRANEMVGTPPFDRRFWGDFLLEFDQAGHVKYQLAVAGIPKPTSESPQTFAPPPISDPGNLLQEDTRSRERGDALVAANADYSEIEASSAAAWFDFAGLAGLSQWRRQHPAEFLRLAKPLLSKAVGRPDNAYHVASLIHALLCNLLVLEPDEAERIYRELMMGGMRVQCNTVHRVPQFYAALWNPQECNLPQHSELRRRMLESARNECDIMTLMIAAMANGGTAEAEKLALERITSPGAKQRAIGVSALAWLCGDSRLRKLRELETSDLVIWLRRHAEWAAEVNSQNAAAIRFYRRILAEPEPEVASTMLAQLEPGLTPSAIYWRREVEHDVLANGHLDGRVQAVLIMFWMSCEHRTSSKLKIADRKLEEWSFGEYLHYVEEPRPAPFMTV